MSMPEQDDSRVRRWLDLLTAVVLFLLVWPVLLVIALAVKLTSPGPVLFRQTRLGRHGKPFEALKFRTMCRDAEERLAHVLATDEQRREEYETYHKLKNDPRLTPVGHWLRRHGLDELPQLWNVLRGEMSLVGPRPYLPRELPKLGASAEQILQVRPGMTGVWQVSGRNRIPFEERVKMEVDYAQQHSLWRDLIILMRTILVVIHGRES